MASTVRKLETKPQKNPFRPVYPKEVGNNFLAALFRVSDETIYRWTKEGILKHCRAGGWYDLAESTEAWAQHTHASGDSPRKTIEEQKALKIARENKVAERQLIPIKDASQIIFEMSAAFNQGIERLPMKIAVRGAMKPTAELSEIAREEVSYVVREFITAGEAAMGNTPQTDQAKDHKDS